MRSGSSGADGCSSSFSHARTRTRSGLSSSSGSSPTASASGRASPSARSRRRRRCSSWSRPATGSSDTSTRKAKRSSWAAASRSSPRARPSSPPPTRPKPVEAAPAEPAGPANATRRAVELASGARHRPRRRSRRTASSPPRTSSGSSPRRRPRRWRPTAPGLFTGISLEGVSLPGAARAAGDRWAAGRGFLESLRSDPEAFRALSSDERCDAYRRHGASIGDGVRLGERTIVVAPRIVLEDGVEIGDDGFVAVRRGVRGRSADELRPAARRAVPQSVRRRQRVLRARRPRGRRRPARSLGDVGCRRSRLRRRRGVHQPLPPRRRSAARCS